MNISVTWRGRRDGARFDSSSSSFAAQNSGNISAISTYSHFQIFAASLDGTGGRPSPTYTPDPDGVARGVVTGNKLSVLAADGKHRVANDGGTGVDEPKAASVAAGPRVGAVVVTAGSPARAERGGKTPSDEPMHVIRRAINS